jgi:hypothetical protein
MEINLKPDSDWVLMALCLGILTILIISLNNILCTL